MHFDIQALIDRIQDLNWLEEPFIVEEIDNVIANLPAHKSNGFDLFNNDFMKKTLASH
jgi:hypothetical protein